MEFQDYKTKELIKQVNKLIPEEADPELNYCLKCYYLGQQPKQEEIDKIIERRNKEIQQMSEILQLTSYDQLQIPSEETKSQENINDGESKNNDSTN